MITDTWSDKWWALHMNYHDGSAIILSSFIYFFKVVLYFVLSPFHKLVVFFKYNNVSCLDFENKTTCVFSHLNLFNSNFQTFPLYFRTCHTPPHPHTSALWPHWHACPAPLLLRDYLSLCLTLDCLYQRDLFHKGAKNRSSLIFSPRFFS